MAARRRWRWSPNLVRVSLAGHSLLGLAFGALLYQVCLTGTLSVFSAELKRWEQPDAPLVRALAPEAYAKAAAEALRREGARGKAVVLFGPTYELPRFEVRVPGAGDNALAGEDGIARHAVRIPGTRLVVSLHEEMHLPSPWGGLLIALVGAVLLALVINGLCAHPRIVRDAFHLRLGTPRRIAEADLHNRLSVWGLPFHITVTLTGTSLALAGLIGPAFLLVAYGSDIDRGITEVLGPQPAHHRMEPVPLPDIAAMIRRIETENAPARVTFVMIEQAGTAGQMLHIDTDAHGHLASGESYRFAGGGEYMGRNGSADGPAAKQLIAALTPLHYGTFAGFPIRLIYGGLGLALCVICATGVNIWLIRRQERGASAILWSRLWVAVVWGQPLVLAIAALAAPQVGPLLSYVALTMSLLLTAALLPAVPLGGLRIATAVALALTAAGHVLRHGFAPSDPMAIAVNGALLAGSILLGALWWRRRLAEARTPTGFPYP